MMSRAPVARSYAQCALLCLLPACSDSGAGPELRGDPVSTVELSAPERFLEQGETLRITALTRDAAGNVLTGRKLEWQSSAPAVAVVADGVVTGVGVGETVIIARSDGVSGSLALSVREGGPLGSLLSGTLRRVEFVIAAGATHRASGDLVLIADREIRIDGSLLADDQTSITLIAPILRLTGVVGLPAEPDGARAIAAAAAVAASAATGNGGAGDVTFNAGRVEIGGAGEPAEVIGARVFIAGRNDPVTGVAPELIITHARIVGAPGRDAQQEGEVGADGGAVFIGTSEARVRAIEQGAASADAFGAARIESSAVIEGGRGGHGFSVIAESQVDVEGRKWIARASAGGTGGHVKIEAATLVLNEPRLEGGRGGNGGSVGTAQSPLRAPDGGLPGESGWDLDATSGSGGGGGALELMGVVQGTFRGGGGGGGVPGSMAAIAGDGAAGGAGGNTALATGAWGLSGSGPAGASEAGPATPPVTILLGGGSNGGHATAADMPGGPGGTVAIFIATVLGTGGSAFESVFIQLPEDDEPMEVGHGGHGFHNCSAPGPGTAGGAAGAFFVHAAGELDGFVISQLHAQFRPGGGGNGVPPGAGGEGSTADIRGQIIEGQPGPAGNGCPLAFRLDNQFLDFHHTVDVSPCPQTIGQVTLENAGTESFDWHFDPDELTGLVVASPESGTLPAGGSVTVTLRFNCSEFASFSGTGKFVVRTSSAENFKQLQVGGGVYRRAVRLDYDLGQYNAGDVIPLDRILDGDVSPRDSGCPGDPDLQQGVTPGDHLHTTMPAGIRISDEQGNSSGPFPDQSPAGCGYGLIVLVQI